MSNKLQSLIEVLLMTMAGATSPSQVNILSSKKVELTVSLFRYPIYFQESFRNLV